MGKYQKLYGNNFDLWKECVDRECVRLVGLGADDLDDYLYRQAFDEGLDPTTVAKKAIRASGYKGPFLNQTSKRVP